MKRWAWLVAGLYFLALVAVTIPFCLAAGVTGLDLDKAAGLYTEWGYWIWVGSMVVCQGALLVVPVKVASRRPVSRRALIWPVLVGGLMAGVLATGALFSLCEAFLAKYSWTQYAALWSGAAVWLGWTAVFYRQTKGAEAKDVISKQCRLMMRGSILELLVAVPSHVYVRSRNECCAGIMTFFGLTFGVSVMLFAFGPSVFFLYAERVKRLRAK